VIEIDEEGMAAFKRSIEAACDTVTALVTESAVAKAPRRTGHLKASIHSSGSASSGYRVIADADYAAYVERGTDKFAAEPYLRPAIHHEYVITQ
jgi:hypothetical protein